MFLYQKTDKEARFYYQDIFCNNLNPVTYYHNWRNVMTPYFWVINLINN